MLRASLWFLYRRSRLLASSLLESRSLVRDHAPGFRQDWKSVAGLTDARRIPPRMIRSEKHGVVWHTAIGETMVPHGAGRAYVSRLSAEMMSVVYALDSRDKVVLDAGANVGMFSRQALLNGAEQVICVEPDPANAACIRSNLRDYFASGQVRLVRKGLWSHDTIVRFNSSNTGNPAAITSARTAIPRFPLPRLTASFANSGSHASTT